LSQTAAPVGWFTRIGTGVTLYAPSVDVDPYTFFGSLDSRYL